ncbi:myosin-3-like [Clinocottus analis]|uniref:myosin-3-like n=1 Tax=Clinocottus analis TaxID=304258 RepID=UPI0035BEC56C
MYQGDTQRHEAQPQDGQEKEAQGEVEEICAQGEMKNLRATIQEKEEAILDLTEKLNLEVKLRSISESNAKVLYSEREYLKNKVKHFANDLEAQTKLGRDNDMAWQLRFSALEESNKKEKSSESNLRPTIQDKDKAILDLTEKLNLEIKLRYKSESNARVLYLEREYLEDQVKSLANDLDAQTMLARYYDKAWQSRFSALEESNKNEKASESNSRPTIQEKEETILDLTEKLKLEIKLRSESESNAKVLYSEMDDLEDEVESLANDLDAQIKLGRDNDMAWQRRFSALEESNKKQKSSDSNLRPTIQENEEAILDLTEKLNLEIKLRSESESNAEVLYSDMDDLENEVESLSKDLHAQIKLRRDSDKAWQLRFSALEEESNNKEKASESSLKALLTECQDMENKIQSLSEDLKAQTKLVSDNNKAWKDKISTLKREHVLKEKTIRTAAHVEREALLQKLKEQSCEMHSVQVKCEFQGEQNDNEEEFQRLRRQIVILEDICLRQKKKNLGFFGRQMEDREVELERMKRKVPAREPVDPPASVHCPPPVDPPAPVQCPPPVDPPAPVQCPPSVEPPAPVQCPPPVDLPAPVQCPPPVDSPAPVQCPSPVDSPAPVHCPPPVHLSNPPTSRSTSRITKALCLVRLP